MNIDRKLLEGLTGIKDEERNALLSIYDGAIQKDAEISELRKKTPTDSQTVVESLDYKKLQDSLKERELLVNELRTKMEGFSGTQVCDPLAAFRGIIDAFNFDASNE